MDSLGTSLLGFLALGALCQAALLVWLGVSGRRLARRVQELQGRMERDLRPALDDVNRIAKNVAEVSEIAAQQIRRVDEMVAVSMDRAEQTRDQIQLALRRPLGRLLDVAALLKGVRRGVRVYRQLGGLQAQGKGAARRYQDDEHLFI
jgi:hypothetical protein